MLTLRVHFDLQRAISLKNPGALWKFHCFPINVFVLWLSGYVFLINIKLTLFEEVLSVFQRCPLLRDVRRNTHSMFLQHSTTVLTVHMIRLRDQLDLQTKKFENETQDIRETQDILRYDYECKSVLLTIMKELTIYISVRWSVSIYYWMELCV